jgi:hypothetical protein
VGQPPLDEVVIVGDREQGRKLTIDGFSLDAATGESIQLR